jgi:hypothetical protein
MKKYINVYSNKHMFIQYVRLEEFIPSSTHLL